MRYDAGWLAAVDARIKPLDALRMMTSSPVDMFAGNGPTSSLLSTEAIGRIEVGKRARFVVAVAGSAAVATSPLDYDTQLAAIVIGNQVECIRQPIYSW